jgi:hypothetical protein
VKTTLSLFLSLSLLILLSAFCLTLLATDGQAQTTAPSNNQTPKTETAALVPTASVAVGQDEILTNKEVISMSYAGLDKTVIINKIKTSKTNFDLSTDSLIDLKQKAIASEILAAMQAAKNGNANIVEQVASTSVTTIKGGVVIPDGTELKTVAIEEVSGKHSVEGDQLTFKIAESVVIDGKVVIAKDAVVKATVTAAKKPGFAGTSGKLSIRIDSTKTVDGQDVKLRASKSGKGGTNTGTTVGLVVLFGPIGLLKHGKDAKIPAGTILSAFTDEAKTVIIVTP